MSARSIPSVVIASSASLAGVGILMCWFLRNPNGSASPTGGAGDHPHPTPITVLEREHHNDKTSHGSALEEADDLHYQNADEAEQSPAIFDGLSGSEKLDALRNRHIASLGYDDGDIELREGKSTTNIIFQFYLSMLESDDIGIRNAAFDRFAVAFGTPFSGLRGRAKEIQDDHDLRLLSNGLFGILEGMQTLSSAESPDGSLSLLRGQSGYNDLCIQVIPYLDDPERSFFARSILNTITSYQYEHKNSHWWRTSFQSSMYSGLLQGVPDRDWKARPE
ncbi:hypothetical protein BH23VER1_BH23VER1_06030 [soil metagenome]